MGGKYSFYLDQIIQLGKKSFQAPKGRFSLTLSYSAVM